VVGCGFAVQWDNKKGVYYLDLDNDLQGELADGDRPVAEHAR